MWLLLCSCTQTGNTKQRRPTERAARAGLVPLANIAQAVVAALQAHAQHAPTTAEADNTGPAAQGSALAPASRAVHAALATSEQAAAILVLAPVLPAALGKKTNH